MAEKERVCACVRESKENERECMYVRACVFYANRPLMLR